MNAAAALTVTVPSVPHRRRTGHSDARHRPFLPGTAPRPPPPGRRPGRGRPLGRARTGGVVGAGRQERPARPRRAPPPAPPAPPAWSAPAGRNYLRDRDAVVALFARGPRPPAGELALEG